MEATLPISAAIEAARPHARTQSAVAAAPRVSIPLRFIASGLLAMASGLVWLVLQPELMTEYHYNQDVIAFTHLIVLGGLCSIVMGVMYQLVPVALETRLYSERLAGWQFVLHVTGFIGMVWMFYRWNMKQAGHYGSVFAMGVALFVYNMARTLRRARVWNLSATSIALALGWLALTVVAGLAIATGKCAYESTEGPTAVGGVRSLVDGLRVVAVFMQQFDTLNAMHAHAHLGLAGFFLTLVVGLSYKLAPMFVLSEVQSPRRAHASLWLMNAGLAGVFLSILLRLSLKPVFAVIIAAGLVLFSVELAAIVRSRSRITLDWGLRSFFSALIVLAPLTLLGLVLSWPALRANVLTGQLENLYGFLAVFGLFVFAVAGMLYKIIPFLVWLHAYGPHVGRAQVPALADLVSSGLQAAFYWTWQPALVLACAGILFSNPMAARLGAMGILVAFGFFLVSLCGMLSHLVMPKISPFPGIQGMKP